MKLVPYYCINQPLVLTVKVISHLPKTATKQFFDAKMTLKCIFKTFHAFAMQEKTKELNMGYGKNINYKFKTLFLLL